MPTVFDQRERAQFRRLVFRPALPALIACVVTVNYIGPLPTPCLKILILGLKLQRDGFNRLDFRSLHLSNQFPSHSGEKAFRFFVGQCHRSFKVLG